MLTPDRFSEVSVYDLLRAAADGKVGLDQRWVRAIIDRGEAAVPDLVRFGSEDHLTDPVPVDEEMMQIFRHLRTTQSIPFFVEYLRQNPEDMPDGLLDALYTLRHDALEPLLQLYIELEEDVAGEVAFALASFGIRDDRVLSILLDRLEYDAGDGALALGLYGDPAARPALEKILAEVQDDEHLKRDIADAMEQLGREEEPDTDAPFDVLRLFPEKSLPETDLLEESELLEMLDATDPEYRFTAAGGFINRDKSPAATDKLFRKAKADAEETVRAKCWEALSTEVADNEEIFAAMLGRLQDSEVPLVERSGALVGLGQRSNEQPVRRYAEELYGNPDTRAAAMAAMWNSLDRSFAKYFPVHLEDPDPLVRKQAISGVGYLGIADSAEKLRTFFDDDEFRANALFAYALSARTEISPGRVRVLLRRIDELAGGLTEEESQLVEIALDERLLLNGYKAVFHPDEDLEGHAGHDHDGHDHEGHDHTEHDHAEHTHPPAPAPGGKVGRNDPCPCGSGKKYKKCHGS